MVVIKSLMACLLYIGSVRIAPQESEITLEDYNKIKDASDFKALVADDKIIVKSVPEDTVVKEVVKDELVSFEDMKVGELREYCNQNKIEIADGATKTEILKTLALIGAE